MGRYRYDKEKLEYVEEEFSWKKLLSKILAYFLASIGAAVLLYLILALCIRTPRESHMKVETRLIQQEYENLRQQTQLLEQVVVYLEGRDAEIYNHIFKSPPPRNYSASHLSDTTYGTETISMAAARLDNMKTLEENCRTAMKTLLSSMDSISNPQSVPSILPIRNFSVDNVGASYGMKIHPFNRTLMRHNGIDLVMPAGTGVLATAEGVVASVVHNTKLDGNVVTLDHGNGYVTRYAYLGEIMLRTGQKVARGQLIARIGNTGTSFGPHLHYDVLLRGEPMDPLNYFFAQLSHQDHANMVAISISNGQSLD